MTNQTKRIFNALHQLGVKSVKVHLEYSFQRAAVFVNGVYFGIYDFPRNTFVD